MKIILVSCRLYTGEGSGTPFQYSCLENPRDGGAWWAAVYGVTQSQTRLKWLSSSSRLYTVWSSLPLWPHFLLLFMLVILFKSHWLPCYSLNIQDMFSFQELFSLSSDPDVCSFPRYNVSLPHFLHFFAQNHPISPWLVQILDFKKVFFFFFNLFLAVVGLHCCKWVFSICG